MLDMIFKAIDINYTDEFKYSFTIYFNKANNDW